MKSSLFAGGAARRTASGDPQQQSPTGSAATTAAAAKKNLDDRTRNAEEVEAVIRENDAMLAALGDATGNMRRDAGNLNRETREHNAIVEQLMRGVGAASNGVRGTVQRLDTAMAKHGFSGTVVCGMIVFVVLMMLYFVTKFAVRARNNAAAATDAPS